MKTSFTSKLNMVSSFFRSNHSSQVNVKQSFTGQWSVYMLSCEPVYKNNTHNVQRTDAFYLSLTFTICGFVQKYVVINSFCAA